MNQFSNEKSNVIYVMCCVIPSIGKSVGENSSIEYGTIWNLSFYLCSIRLLQMAQ